ncbi:MULTISPECIES: RES family NAD+ phosphorylase [unclassified Cedecea]|uniref:RES family NAD+ phosphorylase n=1 Tax=unclassified Cedecea TaxID=2649846 RepID=UPI0030189591
MSDNHLHFKNVSGFFFRAVPAEFLSSVLSRTRPDSPGRYHRPGQTILYMSPVPEWARLAVAAHMQKDGKPRLLVPLYVEDARVLDQRDEYSCLALGINRDLSNHCWLSALQQNIDPPSWQNADRARFSNADGIIDRSRSIPDGWHLNLFRWNELGGPRVTVCGEPIAVPLPENVNV